MNHKRTGARKQLAGKVVALAFVPAGRGFGGDDREDGLAIATDRGDVYWIGLETAGQRWLHIASLPGHVRASSKQ